MTEEIRAGPGVATISEQIRKARLSWTRGEKDGGRCSMRTWKMEVIRHRRIGRLKLRWSDVTRKDMKEKGVKVLEEAQDRRTLRLKT